MFSPADAEDRIFRRKLVNPIAADALDPCVAMTSAAMCWLWKIDRYVLDINEMDYNITIAMSHFSENIFMLSQINQMVKVNLPQPPLWDKIYNVACIKPTNGIFCILDYSEGFVDAYGYKVRRQTFWH